MFGVDDAVLAAGFGSAAAGGLSYLGARSANSSAREIAREQMSFQERMSSTAHQRSMEDLRLAGLNPLLGYPGGASTPGGAGASFGNELGGAVSSATDALRTRFELEAMKAQRTNTEADTRLKQAQAASTLATARNVYAQYPGHAEEAKIDNELIGWLGRRLGRLNPLGGLSKSLR